MAKHAVARANGCEERSRVIEGHEHQGHRAELACIPIAMRQDSAPPATVSVPFQRKIRRCLSSALITTTDQAIGEYLQFWDLVQDFTIDHEQEDEFVWSWESSGQYSTSFLGSINFVCAPAICKSYTPLKCKLFMWLAFRKRCWIADRLQCRGLPNQGCCVFCHS